jgi:hypothetical protein
VDDRRSTLVEQLTDPVADSVRGHLTRWPTASLRRTLSPRPNRSHDPLGSIPAAQIKGSRPSLATYDGRGIAQEPGPSYRRVMMPIEQLVTEVRRRAISTDPVDQLSAALAVAAATRAQTEMLVALHVHQARAAGRTWSEIGQRVGLHPNAARYVFGRPPPVGWPEL